LLLMLMVEKWVSLTLYPAVFYVLAQPHAGPALLDAQYRALVGAGLLATCVLVSVFSRPARRKTWRRARPSRLPAAAGAIVVVLGGCYLLIGGASWLLGGGLRLHLPAAGTLLFWVLGGQALLALAEEVYFRGLLLSEIDRVAPRLGVRGLAARRWVALWATAILFGLEHLALGPPWDEAARQSTFTVSLGLLLGLLVLISANLYYAGAVHAWINWLLLGAAPYFVDATGEPALPPGTYIGITLALAFAVTLALRRWRRGSLYGDRDELLA
jgi:membrane protease YdiL (CAAX protease family)